MGVFPTLEIYEDGVPRSAPMNMALDEVLWQSATVPCLRLYQWDHAALSFGYFGRYEDVASYQPEHEIVRRCTGGGIVFHGADLTYGLIIPALDRRVNSSPLEIYGIVHSAIKNALIAAGTPATLLHSKSSEANGSNRTYSCFANPVRSDVLVSGVKVAGAAQRRSRRGLLQQGSIQQVDLNDDFRQKLVANLTENPIRKTLNRDIIERATEIADQKYVTSTWLRSR
jgi:lipoyl(octanoyl) transferase